MTLSSANDFISTAYVSVQREPWQKTKWFLSRGKCESRHQNKRSAVLRYFGVMFGLIEIFIRDHGWDLTNCCFQFKISWESSLSSKFPLRTNYNIFIEVTYCIGKWWGGPSSKIGSGCTPLGSVCPGVKSSPFNPKHFSMVQIRLLFCMGMNRKRHLWMIFSATSTAALLCE